MTSKYIKINDGHLDEFDNWNFKKLFWYSRPYEYFEMKNQLELMGDDLVVLDAACGFKTPGYSICASLPNVKAVTALDLGKGYAKNFVNNGIDHQKVWKVVGDLTKWNPDRIYDVVVCISSLEHIKNYKKAITTMYNSLKPGGFLFITFDISRNGKKNKFLSNYKLTPLDYLNSFKEVGFELNGDFDDHLYNDIISGANTKFGPSIHENLNCFKFLFKK